MLAMTGAVLAAEEGTLVPVALDANDFPSYGCSFGNTHFTSAFSKAGKYSGITNPHAMVSILNTAFGRVCVAEDSYTAEAAEPEVLRLDFTGKYNFTNALAVRLKPIKNGQYEIVPTRGQIHRGDNSVPITASGSYVILDGQHRELVLKIGTGKEGICRFGDKLRAVRVWDLNGDLRCGGFFKPSVGKNGTIQYPAGNMVVVYSDDTFARPAGSAFVDRCIFLDGRAYQLKVSAEGSHICATPEDVQTGQIRVDHEQWSGYLMSEWCFFLVPDANGTPITLPMGHYAFLRFGQVVVEPIDTPPGFRNSYVDGTAVGTTAGFDVVAGKVTAVSVGTPLTAGIMVSINGRDVNLRLAMIDNMGNCAEHIYPKCARLRDPMIEVFNDAGERIHSGTLAWCSCVESFSHSWRVPSQYKGQFTVRMKCDFGPLEASTKEATFTIN
jgi:hypothetical protein